MRALLFALVTIGLLAPATPGVGEEVYFSVRLRDLAITEGSLPANAAMPRRMGQSAAAMYPWVTLDGPGDAYVWLQQAAWNWINPANMADTGSLVIQVPEKKDVAGYLIFPNADRSAMLRLRFTVPASAASGPARAAFFQGKREHYQRLLAAGAPGAAWFRHEAHQADRALASSSTEVAQAPPRIFPGNWDVNRTYELFTGGRALSENLQLDRELPPGQANENRTVLSSIRGITVQEIDWKPLLKDAKPKLDRLADKVPADQHVVFFPSFAAAMALTGAAKENDTPVLRWAQPRSENAHLAERYQAQLCLPVSDLARLLGPHVVRSVAVTGSDPYFPTGTDVAVLFETPQPAVLEKLLLGRITMDAAKTKGAEPSRGDAHGLAFRAFRSPDRRVSSYLAQLDGAVVVTNSPYQLERLSDVAKGESPSIAALAEYQFFRTRYRLGDPEETALVFLSDPTIRRWCGPKWRIAASRRLRAAAVLSELQAGGMDALVAKTAQGGPIYTDLPLADGGTLALASGGVVSSTYGSIAFLTPIAELPLTEVTQAEATAYERWRDGYQQNWSWAFDPIALRLSLAKDKVGADLTVMPLIANTQYRELIEFSRGVQIPADAGDRHGALAHAVLAINRQSPRFHSAENMFSMMSEGLSLGWLGRCVSIYADDDPFWSELAATEEKDIPKFFENNLGRLPLGLAIDVESGLKMAAFLVAAPLSSSRQPPDKSSGSRSRTRNTLTCGSSPRAAPQCPAKRPTWQSTTPRPETCGPLR